MIFERLDPGIDLDGEWSFAYSSEPISPPPRSVADLRQAGLEVYPAAVPGNFELDLLANGLIAEPFFGMNIVGLRRFEATHVYYARDFAAPVRPGTQPYLVFEGIDCYADIYLNGQLVHRADNMLIEHSIAVADTLRPGELNALCVVIDPALAVARSPEFEYPAGLEAEGSGYESLYVRKPPHMYGWDIMPRALSAGLWRPVTLRHLPAERLDWVWLETQDIAADASSATLALHYRAIIDALPASAYSLRVSGSSGQATFEYSHVLLFEAGSVNFRVPSPQLWWPRGRGEPNLYDVRAELMRDGAVIDSVSFRHGIRTVDLVRSSVTTDDGQGEFCFLVNGERVFVLGTNWVPLDAYHSRDVDRIEAALALAEDLACNMIRCWGGNVYENDAFYDLCDSKGILVWQDFAMACAIYPQDAAFQSRLAVEVRQVARRLRQHASIVLWCGDNECDQKYLRARRRDPNTNVLTRAVIPAVLRDEDGSRPYLPSSPYVDEVALPTGEQYLPENHLWRSDYYKDPLYTTAPCHFVSEIGFLGCPEPESLRSFLSPDKVWPYEANEEWLAHSTSGIADVHLHDYRVDLMVRHVRSLFGAVPDTLDAFAFASQSAQAEALKFFIEMFRLGKWRRTGILWWNLLDGWPQVSDAVVDYYLRKKRAFEIIRRSQARLCVIAREPAHDMQEFAVVNDTRDDLSVDFVVRDVDTDEILLGASATAVADAVTPLGRTRARADIQRCLTIGWQSLLGSGQNHYVAGRPPFSLEQYRSWMVKLGM